MTPGDPRLPAQDVRAGSSLRGTQAEPGCRAASSGALRCLSRPT